MTRLTWPAVGLLAVLGAVVVALAIFTDMQPEAIIALVSLLAGIGGGTAIVGTVAGRVDQVHAETTAQTAQLATIERRTNGELDERIAAAQEEAAEQGAARVIAVLREQGVIR